MSRIKGKAYVLGDDIDTDQIIPAKYLMYNPADAKERPLFGRFAMDGVPVAGAGLPGGNIQFVDQSDQNNTKSEYKIIIGGKNFGCGSSREAAVNALTANRIRAVIAPAFGDIHYSNCVKNGVLPVRLLSTECEQIRSQLHQSPGASIDIDLEDQIVSGPDGARYVFEIDQMDKLRLIKGLDDISLTLEHQTAIEAFERNYRKNNRWIF